ncbi:MAG: RNA chaperone Hfq [Cyanobacterium sp. T60_A2020_053]|nr:RNA chaperone Hfq [Cyanobacterium sp. T60_A2020_053]MBF2058621.1 RNA chaperone Hfq [Cyanobacterium sp. T60_A2020_053]
MSAFNTGLPSVRQIQTVIKEKKAVEIGLTTNKVLNGNILWQDENCLCLTEHNRKTLIWLHSIAYITLS